VLAATSITATTGATIEGRLLAGTGAVTLDHNTVTRARCTTTTPTTGSGGSTTVPIDDETGATTATTAATADTPSIPEDSGDRPPTGTDTDTDTLGPSVPSTPIPPADRPPAGGPPGTGGPRLPYTGIEAGPVALAGMILIGIGMSARYLSRRRHVPLHAQHAGR